MSKTKQQEKKWPKRPTKAKVIDTIMKRFGNISVCARSWNVERNTFYNWIKSYNIGSEILEQAKERRLDFVESMLDKNIEAGKETSIIFFLKTQGRNRGYADDGSSITINSEKTKITLGDGQSFDI